MSGDKIKANDKKKKRGIRGESLDFVSPLTEQECIEHLKSGRSNLSEYVLRVHTHDDQFRVQFMRKGFLGIKRGMGRFDSSYTVQSERLAASSVRFEGKLESHPAGTRVTGKIVRGFGTSRIGLGVQQGIALVLLLLLFLKGVLNVDTGIQLLGWSLLSTVLFLIVTAIFAVNRRSFNRQADALLAWVTDRLDIQR
jgi:hypothetical protein